MISCLIFKLNIGGFGRDVLEIVGVVVEEIGVFCVGFRFFFYIEYEEVKIFD